jgi:hypothetical protein
LQAVINQGILVSVLASGLSAHTKDARDLTEVALGLSTHPKDTRDLTETRKLREQVTESQIT